MSGEPDWKAVAQLVMQQRDRAQQHAHNLEIDLAIARARLAELEKPADDSPAERSWVGDEDSA